MRLQSDPTIIYGIFGGKGKPNGYVITAADRDTPTPYNTYTIDGLPPGPIANPGRAALEAVANPSRTRDLFFVADGIGRSRLRRDLRGAPAQRRPLAARSMRRPPDAPATPRPGRGTEHGAPAADEPMALQEPGQ